MNGISSGVWQLLVLFGPLICAVVLLQIIEHHTQKRMTRHFGWRSNLWTGWIGAPVHEYSHALVAWLFGHRVEKIVPFQPEEKTGRLGYVIINYDPKSRWQTMGHFFVCYAPLAGGTLALFLLTFLFYPAAIHAEFRVAPEELFSTSLTQATDQLGMIVTLQNFASLNFWIFSYLVLCVACHMAPSSVDYKGSARGHRQFALIALIVLPIFVLLGGFPTFILSAVAPLFLILQANFIFAVLLCAVLLLIVYIITELMTWLS